MSSTGIGMFEKLYMVSHLFVWTSTNNGSKCYWNVHFFLAQQWPSGGWVVFKILRNIEYKITHYYHLTAIIKQLLSLKVFKNKPRGWRFEQKQWRRYKKSVCY